MTSSGDESDARPCGDGESPALHARGMDDAPGDNDRAGNRTPRGRVTPSSAAGLFVAEKGSWRMTSWLEDSRVGGMEETEISFRKRADGEGASAMEQATRRSSRVACKWAIRTAEVVWRRSTLQHHACGRGSVKYVLRRDGRGVPGHCGDDIMWRIFYGAMS